MPQTENQQIQGDKQQSANGPDQNSIADSLDLAQLSAHVVEVVRRHPLALLLIVAIPLVLELIALTMQQMSISLQVGYLAVALTLFGNALLVCLATAYRISSLRDTGPQPLAMLKLSIGGLPKVFLSYLGLLFTISAAVSFLPLLLLAPFFIWAPFFCAAELFAKKKKRAKADEEHSDEDDTVSFFENKSSLDLGFQRSIRFTMQRWQITLSFILLLWFVNIFPSAVFSAFGLIAYNPISMFFATLVSDYISAAIMLVMTAALLVSLPASASKELSLEGDVTESLDSISEATQKLFSSYLANPQSRVIFSLALVLVAGLCTYTQVGTLRGGFTIPESARFAVLQQERYGDLLKVRLQISDPEAQMRWLNAKQISIRYPMDSRSQQSATNLEQGQQKFSNISVSRVGILKGSPGDSKEEIYSGRELQESVTLVLYFQAPDLPPSQDYELIYREPLAEKKTLLSSTSPASGSPGPAVAPSPKESDAAAEVSSWSPS